MTDRPTADEVGEVTIDDGQVPELPEPRSVLDHPDLIEPDDAVGEPEEL